MQQNIIYTLKESFDAYLSIPQLFSYFITFHFLIIIKENKNYLNILIRRFILKKNRNGIENKNNNIILGFP